MPKNVHDEPRSLFWTLATSLAFLSYLLPLQHCHREKARKVGLIKSIKNVKANGRSRILSKWDTKKALFPNIFEL